MSRWFTRALAPLLLAGCVKAPGGDASFTLMSMRSFTEQQVEYVEHVVVERCEHNLFNVEWGEASNHEWLVAQVLQEHDGDALTNADLRTETVPALVYYRSCSVVEGDVIRFAGRGAR